jgi:diaminopimelate decarboxylase
VRALLPPAGATALRDRGQPPAGPAGAAARQLVDGLDVASGGELALALAAGHGGEDIGFAWHGKRDDELAAAIEAGALVKVRIRAGELARLAGLAERSGRRALAALRVRPRLRPAASRACAWAAARGCSASTSETVLGLARRVAVRTRLRRLPHLDAGSQNLNGEEVAAALRRSHALCARLAARAPASPRCVNLGGGFGIPYFAGDTRLDTAPIGDALAELAREHAAQFPHARLVLELGRYLVGEAGVFLTRVLDRKRLARPRVPGLRRRAAPAPGGLRQLRPGDPPRLPAVAGALPGGSRQHRRHRLRTPVHAAGRAGARSPAAGPDVAPGDLLAIGQSGACRASASPTGFLSHPPAAQILVAQPRPGRGPADAIRRPHQYRTVAVGFHRARPIRPAPSPRSSARRGR